MSDDRPVTLTLAGEDGVKMQVRCAVVERSAPDGFLTVRNPAAYDADPFPEELSVQGDDILMVARDRVVAIEGSVDAMEGLLPPTVGETLESDVDTEGLSIPMGGEREQSVYDDPPEECPECTADIPEQLGGGVTCPVCGWSE